MRVRVEICETWMVRVRVAVEVVFATSCASARRGRRKATRMLMKCIVIALDVWKFDGRLVVYATNIWI